MLPLKPRCYFRRRATGTYATWGEQLAKDDSSGLVGILTRHEAEILNDWLALQQESGAGEGGRISETQLRAQSKQFLTALNLALTKSDDPGGAAFAPVRELLAEVSRTRAVQGYSPTETATFVFSLKQPIFRRIEQERKPDPAQGVRDTWTMSKLVDSLGLYVMDMYQKSREEVIIRQQQEISELSTPVVQLWKGIVALPLIGTLDSARTQVVMENLLQTIVEVEAEIAIIDITGVPTVDTLVAQYLLKTVAAARLMGADCIISGVRAQIAQTMVHLGVELNVVSKANMADAFGLALRRTGRTVTRIKKDPQSAPAAE